jgi:DNA invertase Pin-like site-specific DNA recombinase
MKKVIELIRVSTERQAGEDRASIPAQRAINRRTAHCYKLEIIQSIELVDVSGAAVLRTPEIQKLLKLIRDPEIEGVLVRELSRVMRPQCFADYVLFQVLQESKTVLYLPEGPLDLNTKFGRLQATIRTAMAALEVNEMMERSWAAKEQKRRAGKHPDGDRSLPFGVGFDETRGGWFYTPEAEKVRKIFELFLSGEEQYREIARKSGVDYRLPERVLRNAIYSGWRVTDTRRDPMSSVMHTKADGRRARRPLIKRQHEDVLRMKVFEKPLVGAEEFERVQTLIELKKQKHWNGNPNYQSPYLFRGFLRCNRCGDTIYTDGGYVCKRRCLRLGCTSPRQPREPLEGGIERLLGDQIADPDFIDQIIAAPEALADRARTAESIARLESEARTLQEERQHVIEAYIDCQITREERWRRLLAIQRDVDMNVEALKKQRSGIPLSGVALAEIFSIFSDWKTLDCKQKRELLASIACTIHVEDCQPLSITLLLKSRQSANDPPGEPWVNEFPFAVSQETFVIHLPVMKDIE